MQLRRNADVIVESLTVAGKQIIDVGCGDGSLVRHLTKNGAHVLGVECSPRQLAKAAQAERVGDEQIVAGVGQALPAADGSAEIVVFFNSLHHIPAAAMGQALAEAVRVLTANGCVYISEPVAEGLFFQTCRPIDDETQVRDLAYQALQTCPDLRVAQEFTYLHPMIFPDYEAFREKIISANAEREAQFATMDEDMRHLFRQNGRQVEKGWEFHQPMRVNILTRVDA